MSYDAHKTLPIEHLESHPIDRIESPVIDIENCDIETLAQVFNNKIRLSDIVESSYHKICSDNCTISFTIIFYPNVFRMLHIHEKALRRNYSYYCKHLETILINVNMSYQ
jgi:hypothetical protein